MTSKTKQHISKNIISEIFNKHSLGNVINTTVLTGGKFNTVLKIQTEDQNQYVTKIAPDSSTEVLTYEQQLIKSEVYIYKLLYSPLVDNSISILIFLKASLSTNWSVT